MVAIVPFLWQPSASSSALVRGSDMSDDELRASIRDARDLGLKVMVKPHIWVNGSWAGAVAPADGDWPAWFSRYRAEIIRLAHIAAEESADVFCIGTELSKTIERPEWIDLISAVRAVFPRKLVYVAHNAEEAEKVGFWDKLDFVGGSLYPPLGADDDVGFRGAAMRDSVERLESVSERTGKPILIGEIGIRSARGAAAKPWESAEERDAEPDPQLQSDVLADWLRVLDRPRIHGVLVWRWFTDPDAGGPFDTDFTVQGKPAAQMLRCAWTHCAR